MFIRRSKDTHPPNGWTQEMLKELLGESQGGDELSNYLFAITRVQREIELTEKGAVDKVTFYGKIGSPEGSLLRFVRVIVQALDHLEELKSAVGRSEDLPPLSMGYMVLSTQKELYGQPDTPILHINLLGGKNLESELIWSLSATKHFANTYLPLWVWARVATLRAKKHTEIMDWKPENFPLIERCRFQQALDLCGPVAQDKMLF